MYLLGNGIYKSIVYGRFPLSHVLGLIVLAILMPFGSFANLLVVGASVTAILIGVAAWETVSRRGTLRQRSVSEA